MHMKVMKEFPIGLAQSVFLDMYRIVGFQEERSDTGRPEKLTVFLDPQYTITFEGEFADAALEILSEGFDLQ